MLALLAYKTSGGNEDQTVPTSTVTTSADEESVATPYVPLVSDDAPVAAHSYTNSKFGFSLAYPEELEVADRIEKGGAHTVTFESLSGEKGFQIFIRPYTEAQISSSAIQKDTRDSAKGEPVEIVVGEGIRALLFGSSNPLFGEMREVWFLHDGYLYEVTTYADLESWLSSIMESWRFL